MSGLRTQPGRAWPSQSRRWALRPGPSPASRHQPAGLQPKTGNVSGRRREFKTLFLFDTSHISTASRAVSCFLSRAAPGSRFSEQSRLRAAWWGRPAQRARPRTQVGSWAEQAWAAGQQTPPWPSGYMPCLASHDVYSSSIRCL